MKKLIAAILLLCSSNTMALGINLPHPYDYGMHALGGYIIADGMMHMGFSKTEALATVMVVAVLKEASDKNFDVNDAAAWWPGAIIRFNIPFK